MSDFKLIETSHSVEAEDKERTPFPPYHMVPNSIYEIGLNPFEIVVYCYLSRRIGKTGAAYPKLETICQETGIRSKGTVRKALRSLMRWGFIEMVLPATHRSPARYKVRPFAVEAAAKAIEMENQESDNHSEVHVVNPELSSRQGELKGGKTSETDAPDVPQGFTRRTSEVHETNPKEELFKEDSVKEEKEGGEKKNSQEKEAFPFCGAPSPQGDSALVLSGESTPPVSPVPREIPSTQTSLLTKANRYYHALSQTEKDTFEREARRIHYSKSMPSLVELRESRSKFFGLMQFALQTYSPSADAVEVASKSLEVSRAARIAEIGLGH